MIDIDDYTEALSDKLNNTATVNFTGKEFLLMIESKRQPVFRWIKIILRIEILICLYEIGSEIYSFTRLNDAWSSSFSMLNIFISAGFIVIFLSLIKKINNPLNKTLSIKENTELILAVMQRFYKNYIRFALYYALLNMVYNTSGILLEKAAFEDGKEVLHVMDKIKDPFWRYFFLIGYEIVFALLLYLLAALIIRLFYRKRIKQLQMLVDEINN